MTALWNKIPTRYGDGSPVTDPTDEDFQTWAYEDGLKAMLAYENQDLNMRGVEAEAEEWAIYAEFFWRAFYGEPNPTNH